MFDVKIDQEKNRIYITIGEIDSNGGKQLYDCVLDALQKLNEGFTCITDISEFQVLGEDEYQYSEKIVTALVDAGMSKSLSTLVSQFPSRFLNGSGTLIPSSWSADNHWSSEEICSACM